VTGTHECFHIVVVVIIVVVVVVIVIVIVIVIIIIIIIIVNSEGLDMCLFLDLLGEVGPSIFSSVIPCFFSLLVYTSVHVGYPVCVCSL